MVNQTFAGLRTADLARELATVEDEVCALAGEVPSIPGAGEKLLELAAREYEILAALSRPWMPWPDQDLHG